MNSNGDAHWDFSRASGSGEPWLSFNSKTREFTGWDGLDSNVAGLADEMLALVPEEEIAMVIATAMLATGMRDE